MDSRNNAINGRPICPKTTIVISERCWNGLHGGCGYRLAYENNCQCNCHKGKPTEPIGDLKYLDVVTVEPPQDGSRVRPVD